jgi:hypothetical protein
METICRPRRTDLAVLERSRAPMVGTDNGVHEMKCQTVAARIELKA